MSEDTQRPIVVKRVRKRADDGHGGAWKIAYADFVTAMMAFFLLMWLIGSSTRGQLKGIADYFQTPLRVAFFGGSGSGDATSLIKGGGRNLTRTVGQVKQGEIKEKKRTAVNLKTAEAELARKEKARLRDLKKRIEHAIEDNPALNKYRNQMLLDITSEGLRIQIVDKNNRPMFANGSAILQPFCRDILRAIGKTLNNIPNRITISGHTDAKPYAGGEKGYSNWELSADRANAARRELVDGGLNDGRVLRVVGLASAVPFDPTDPLDPMNRRISIIVMNKKAEEAVRKDAGGAVRDNAKAQAQPGANTPPNKQVNNDHPGGTAARS